MLKKIDYYDKLTIDPIKLENIEEKHYINHFENNTIHVNVENLRNKKKLNEIR